MSWNEPAFDKIVRLYLHQGGPLALQSQVQLNEGGQLTVIKSSFFDDISLKLGLSFYDMWYVVSEEDSFHKWHVSPCR